MIFLRFVWGTGMIFTVKSERKNYFRIASVGLKKILIGNFSREIDSLYIGVFSGV
jgi:hypothetical protein